MGETSESLGAPRSRVDMRGTSIPHGCTSHEDLVIVVVVLVASVIVHWSVQY